MQNIQKNAIETYQDNMSYFQENHPQVHTRLLALDTIMANESYTPKYDLEYTDDGYFDIKELSSGSFLYNQNSEEYSQKLLEEVTYKKDDQVFESQRNYNFEKDTTDFLKEAHIYNNFSTYYEIINYHNTHINKSEDMVYLDKYIFFGTGLGFHIEKIVNKFDLQVILVIEDNVELFRLSMFTCNYKKLFKNRDVFFSIGQNAQEFHYTFHNFYTKAFIKNHYIKFTTFSSLYKAKMNVVQSLLITRPEATYSHERMLLKSKKVIQRIKEQYKFINTTKKVHESFFAEKPFLVLGAGPSLKNNEKWLQENHQNFIIIAAFTSLKTLQNIGVKPDIVAQIDENERTTAQMLENLQDLDFLKDALFMFSASVSEELFKKFKHENIYLHEDRTLYKNSTSTIVVASVGETIYAIPLIFNASKIYLLGLDLALNKEGQTHSSDHFKATTIAQKDTKKEDNSYHLDKDIIPVKGNFQNTVQSTPLFAMSIPVINILTAKLKTKAQTIYNMSDGAYFENMIPLHTSEYTSESSLDKSNITEELREYFDSYSTTELTHEELAALRVRERFIKELYDLIDAFENKTYTNKDVFYVNFMHLVNTIIANGYNNELKEILGVYFLKTASFIADFFNTGGLKNPKRHSKKFKHILVKQLRRIVEAYEDELKEILPPEEEETCKS